MFVQGLAQRQAVRQSPDARHAHLEIATLVPIVRSALAARPELVPQLVEAQRETLAIVCAAASLALGMPIAWTGGLYDANGRDHGHRGNGWAQLLHVAQARDAIPCANTARRAWRQLIDDGIGIRVERNDRAGGGPPKPMHARMRRRAPRPTWTSPKRLRLDGTPFPTSEREYTARRIRSVAYLSAGYLRASLVKPLVRELADALQAHIPKSLRAQARMTRQGRTYRAQLSTSRAQAQARKKARRAGVISKRESFEDRKSKRGTPSRGDSLKPLPDGPGPVAAAVAEPRRPAPPPTALLKGASRGGGSPTPMNPIPPGAARRAVREAVPEWRAPWEKPHGPSSR